jgi:hypothetical protein
MEKGPRHSAGLGKGLAKAAAKREAKALQEAIDAGLVKVKGRGKKVRREKGGCCHQSIIQSKGYTGHVSRPAYTDSIPCDSRAT